MRISSGRDETVDVDVLVAGGGPGGLCAAHHLFEAGYSVILVDARRVIGTPLRCAEATRGDFFGIQAQKPGKDWVRWDLGGWLILDRSKTELGLARRLQARGVTVWSGCAVTGVGPFESERRTVRVHDGRGERTLSARLVVAADGVSSRVARFAGMDTQLGLLEVCATLAYRMEGLEHIDSSAAILEYLPELSPHYFWIIPTGERGASVGLGLPGHRGHAARPILDRLIKERRDLRGGFVAEEAVGWYPAVPPLERPFDDGLLVIGGAARMVGANTGEGIWQAALSGREAAHTFIDARGRARLEDLAPYRDRLDPMYAGLFRNWESRVQLEKRST
jgi:digeranylgeranylglycerophospholipid reductase